MEILINSRIRVRISGALLLKNSFFHYLCHEVKVIFIKVSTNRP